MVEKPRVAPYAEPTSSTENVWPEIGTGVPGMWNETCADRATNRAPPPSRIASVSHVGRGMTAVLSVRRGATFALIACLRVP